MGEPTITVPPAAQQALEAAADAYVTALTEHLGPLLAPGFSVAGFASCIGIQMMVRAMVQGREAETENLVVGLGDGLGHLFSEVSESGPYAAACLTTAMMGRMKSNTLIHDTVGNA